MDSVKATTTPNAAPDLLTDRRRNAIVIRASGANVENSHRVGDMTNGSINKPNSIFDFSYLEMH